MRVFFIVSIVPYRTEGVGSYKDTETFTVQEPDVSTLCKTIYFSLSSPTCVENLKSFLGGGGRVHCED